MCLDHEPLPVNTTKRELPHIAARPGTQRPGWLWSVESRALGCITLQQLAQSADTRIRRHAVRHSKRQYDANETSARQISLENSVAMIDREEDRPHNGRDRRRSPDDGSTPCQLQPSWHYGSRLHVRNGHDTRRRRDGSVIRILRRCALTRPRALKSCSTTLTVSRASPTRLPRSRWLRRMGISTPSLS